MPFKQRKNQSSVLSVSAGETPTVFPDEADINTMALSGDKRWKMKVAQKSMCTETVTHHGKVAHH